MDEGTEYTMERMLKGPKSTLDISFVFPKHQALGMELTEVLKNPKRPQSHNRKLF